MTDVETRHARYRQGICVECGVQPHSAGRPRCNDCHVAHASGEEPTKEVTA